MNEAPAAVQLHAVIRQSGRFLMLYSGNFGYYKFPNGEMQDGETPEQALCRIISAQTGLALSPKGCRLLMAVKAQNADGGEQLHQYYLCKVSGALSEAGFAESDRFTAAAVSRAEALTANSAGEHGILADDQRFQAMLERENLALRACRRLTPYVCSVIVLIAALLIPVIGGLSCLMYGFHSPTDGGFVQGFDAFTVGLVLGIFPAGPAVAISIVSIAVSAVSRRRAIHKMYAYILPCAAAAVTLLYIWAAVSLGG